MYVNCSCSVQLCSWMFDYFYTSIHKICSDCLQISYKFRYYSSFVHQCQTLSIFSNIYCFVLFFTYNIPTYQILKSVMGSIHLGGISRFGEKAGSQCTCNAFYYLFWCRVRSVAFCGHIVVLIFGHKLYKSLDTSMHPHVDEVSRTILHYEIVCHTTLSNLDD